MIGVNAYHRSDARKTALLDRKCDKLVNSTAKSADAASERHLLRRMMPFE